MADLRRLPQPNTHQLPGLVIEQTFYNRMDFLHTSRHRYIIHVIYIVLHGLQKLISNEEVLLALTES